MTTERCMCGDTQCPSCGTAQSTRRIPLRDRVRYAVEEALEDAGLDGAELSATWETDRRWSPLRCCVLKLLVDGRELARGNGIVPAYGPSSHAEDDALWYRALGILLRDINRYDRQIPDACEICDREMHPLLLQREGICMECWQAHEEDAAERDIEAAKHRRDEEREADEHFEEDAAAMDAPGDACPHCGSEDGEPVTVADTTADDIGTLPAGSTEQCTCCTPPARCYHDDDRRREVAREAREDADDARQRARGW